MHNFTEVIKNIGKVEFRAGKGKKYYSIKLKPFEGVVVTIPSSGNLKEARNFVKRKESWICKKLGDLQYTLSNYSEFDFDTTFQTKHHKLKIEPYAGAKVVARIANKTLTVRIPQNREIKSDYIQKSIRHAIEETWRAEAKQYLPHRLWELAKKHGFTYNDVRIKNLKSRWGSCSSKKNINLNLHLMNLPDELIDYVLLHELTHTKEGNHSPNFWNRLESVCTGAKVLDKKLSKYKIGIY